MATDYRFVTFRQPAEQFFPTTTIARSVDLDFALLPGVEAYMDGWEAVSFQVATADDSVFITVMLRQETTIPDDPRI